MAKEISAKDLGSLLETLAQRVPEDLHLAIIDTGVELQGRLVQEEIAKTKPHQPVASGAYKGSWRGAKTKDGYVVMNLSRQSVWVERGRRPGGSPGAIYRALKLWARLRGVPRGAVWPIAVKIAHEGYKPRWVLKRASERATIILRKRLRAALGKRAAAGK